MATNYKAIIEQVCAKFADQLVQPAATVNDVGRSLLPHFIAAMPATEQANWGVLEKRTSTPYNVPYDILVKKDTREHFDVLTSRAVSGDEKNDKTGPRRLIATWGAVGVLPKSTWHWCEPSKTTFDGTRPNPIIPLESLLEPPPDQEPEPSDPDERDRLVFAKLDQIVALINDIRDLR
jgi:hypothetical protein